MPYNYLMISVCFFLLSCGSNSNNKNIRIEKKITTIEIDTVNNIEIEKSKIEDSLTTTENPKIKNENKKENNNIEITNDVKPGQTLSSILSKFQVSNKDILQIAGQSIIDFNFNSLQIGKSYKIILKNDSSIISFLYEKKKGLVYSVIFSDELNFKKSSNLNFETELMNEEKIIKNNNNTDLMNFLMGKFDPKNHPDFILVDNIHHNKNQMYLHKETLEAFIKMKNAAKLDGILLKIVSGTRNFYDQKKIWERKFDKYKKDNISEKEIIKKIMLWSSMPATSRHHWGTDIDINGFDEYFTETNEKAKKEYKWLSENAHLFGFCQVYSSKNLTNRKTGYNEEKWHWSYMPLSEKFLNQYRKFISYNNISGFSGSNAAKELNIIENFVFGVNTECN